MRTTTPFRFAALSLAALPLLTLPSAAQETPQSLVAAYERLADTILAVRGAEAGLVGAILDGHLHAARELVKNGDWEGASAQVALFANEGDNAVGGVRKRLLEGGHHFNAEGEEQGVFEPGFVLVSKEAKQGILAASSAMRRGADDAARQAAWQDFQTLANQVLERR